MLSVLKQKIASDTIERNAIVAALRCTAIASLSHPTLTLFPFAVVDWMLLQVLIRTFPGLLTPPVPTLPYLVAQC